MSIKALLSETARLKNNGKNSPGKVFFVLFFACSLFVCCFSLPIVSSDFVQEINGVVLALPMNEGSGATSKDYSGYSNNVAWVDGASLEWYVGAFSGVRFSGNAADFGIVPYSASLNLTNNFSFEIGFQYIDNGADQAFFSKWNVSTQKSYVLSVTPSDFIQFIGSDDGTTTRFSQSAIALTNGTYYHFVMVFNGTYINWYNEGVLLEEKVWAYGAIKQSISDFRLGQIYLTTYPCASLLDFVRIYNKALSFSEIQLLHNEQAEDRVKNYNVMITNGVLPNSTVEGFSIVNIGDTQYLSKFFPEYNTKLAQFIVSQKTLLNIKAVSHTGDLSEDNNANDWASANNSMSLLYDAEIPFSWNAGNHDLAWIGNTYKMFNSTTFSGSEYWLSSTDNSDSTAISFSEGGEEYVLINVAYDASNVTLLWVEDVIETHLDSKIIVSTHSYLNHTGGYGFAGSYEWASNFNTFLNGFSNVIVALSGHDNEGTTNTTTSYYVSTNNRSELFFNRQSMYKDAGACAAKILAFNGDNVTVSVYDVLNEQYVSENAFSFLLPSEPIEPTPTPTATPEPTPTTSPTSSPLPTSTYGGGGFSVFDPFSGLSLSTLTLPLALVIAAIVLCLGLIIAKKRH